MKKVSELTGAELDYWVARAEGLEPDWNEENGSWCIPPSYELVYSPSHFWGIAVPIIERERINLNCRGEYALEGFEWAAQIFPTDPPISPVYGYGPTPLIAAMRAFVASRYGEEVPEVTPMSKWTSRFMDMARLVASWSKDPSTKVGAVIVDNQNRVVSLGYNGPPRGVEDDPTISREAKLRRTIHAEKNAILFSRGGSAGSTLYVTHFPCAQCAAMIVQSGIAKVVCPVPSEEFAQRWKEEFEEAQLIFKMAGIPVFVAP